MTIENGNGRVIERIKKLLALAAKGSGATEAEAILAAAKAAELMEEHGLTAMAVETSGGTAEDRERGAVRADLRGSFYAPLMEAVAESCFCWVSVSKNQEERKWEFTLIGRKSAVTTASLMYDYLARTIKRLSRETKPASDHQFCSGAVERIAERLRSRHAQRLREQKEEVDRRRREEATRAQHPGSAPSTSTSLVVSLVDYEQRERDLNEDFRWGRTPGSTEQDRLASQARQGVKDARYKFLKESGVPDGVAFNMAYFNMSRERAEEYEKEWTAKQEAPRRKTKADEREEERQERAYYREARRRATPSWTSGRRAGEDVGLDRQIDKKDSRKLT